MESKNHEEYTINTLIAVKKVRKPFNNKIFDLFSEYFDEMLDEEVVRKPFNNKTFDLISDCLDEILDE